MEFLKQLIETKNNNVAQVLIKKNVSCSYLIIFKNIGKANNSCI